jgi:type I restriction enzyme S subunit
MKEYKVKDLLTIKNGRDHKHLGNGSFPVYGSGGIMRYANDFLYDKPSILLPRKGTLDNIQYCDTPFWCVDTTYYSEVNDELANPYYLYRYLNILDLRNLDSGTALPSMTFESYYQIKVKLPDIETQNKIAKALYSLDQKIAINTRINAELEAMAKQLYDYWFVQFDFPDENGKPYKSSGGKMVWNEKLKREIPDGWEVKEISSILDKVKSTPRLVTDEYLKLGDFPIIDQATDVYYAGFTNREDAVSHQYPAVIFGDHSCAVKYVNFPFVRGADGTQVMLSKNKNVSIEYLYFVIKQIKVSKGYARHYGFIKDSLIIIPSHTITLKFKSVVELLFFQITESRKEMVYLTHLRDSLLPMLMNGQVTIE